MNGILYKEPVLMKEIAKSYFEELFKQSGTTLFSPVGISFKSISAEQVFALTCPFSEEEIYTALMSCKSSKAPGLDKFKFCFYKKAWQILKEDILSVFSDFY